MTSTTLLLASLSAAIFSFFLRGRAASYFIAAGFLFAIAGVARGQNIVGNPGFEDPVAPIVDNWMLTIGSLGAGSTVLQDNTDPHSGAFDILLEVNSGTLEGAGNVFITQQTALNSIIPGETYDISFWARTVEAVIGPGLVAFYRVDFLDSDGSHGGGVKGATPLTQFQAGLTQTYSQIGLSWIAPAEADSAYFMIQLVGGAFDESDGGIYVDDASISLQAIPEPSAIAFLLAGGAIVGIVRLGGRRA